MRTIQRGETTLLRPFDDLALQEGDRISINLTRRQLSELVAERHSPLPGHDDSDEGRLESGAAVRQWVPGRQAVSMAEAIVPPGSFLIGKTLRSAQRSLGRVPELVAVQRRTRMLRRPPERIHLEAGDVVLALGAPDDVRGLRFSSDLVLLEWSSIDIPTTQRAPHALAIFLAVIAVSALDLIPIAIAALLGAIAMVMTRCLSVTQAVAAFDRRIFLLIGAAFALSTALAGTGGAALIAQSVTSAMAGYGTHALLVVLFGLTALLTNVLSNQATAALMTPITIAAALKAGAPLEPFLYGLIFALNCSFATPFSYQTNLLVMTPGQYRFRDFLVGGLPLIGLIWLAYSLIAPWVFELT